MIHVPLIGGLGNQMFVYAYYRYLLSKGYNAKFYFGDLIFTSLHNGVELFQIFPNIHENIPKRANIYISINRFVSNKPFLNRCLKLASRIYYRTFKIYRQKNAYSFDDFDFKHRRIIVDGAWQNIGYLKPIEDDLKKTFVFDISSLNETDIISQIQNTESVSIHVRRGDYLNPQYSSLNVISNEQYYFDSINALKSKYEGLRFFVFSDDIEWCKQIFKGSEFTFVMCNTGGKSYLDMYYMSQCKHNIISNSTFSWWAAWLNRNKKKEVFAPNIWTRTGIQSKDICPQTWNFISIKS